MDHLTNLRDPHAIIGLVPWVESLATAHPQVYEIMNAVKDNEGRTHEALSHIQTNTR